MTPRATPLLPAFAGAITESHAQALISRHYLPGVLPADHTWSLNTVDPFAAIDAVQGDALVFLLCPADGPDMLIVGYPPAKIVQMSLWGEAA